nr:hypothetical protein [Anaerolineaceae bacterium]
TELESNLLHAVMMTSNPQIFYWNAASLKIMKSVQNWRKTGIPVCYTLDAGPNVHVICPISETEKIIQKLNHFSQVNKIIIADPGGETRIF